VRTLIPQWQESSTSSRSDREPASWPAEAGNLFWRAHLALPSMITATCFGIRSSWSSAGSGSPSADTPAGALRSLLSSSSSWTCSLRATFATVVGSRGLRGLGEWSGKKGCVWALVLREHECFGLPGMRVFLVGIGSGKDSIILV
jgi:hypothetical protein